MLEGVVGPGGTAPMAAIPGVVVAGKTGTTTNYADAWFVGWTPQMTTAVWVGYPHGVVPMTTDYNGAPVEGGTFPAIIWHNFMVQALQILASESSDRLAERADDPDALDGAEHRLRRADNVRRPRRQRVRTRRLRSHRLPRRQRRPRRTTTPAATTPPPVTTTPATPPPARPGRAAAPASAADRAQRGAVRRARRPFSGVRVPTGSGSPRAEAPREFDRPRDSDATRGHDLGALRHPPGRAQSSPGP